MAVGGAALPPGGHFASRLRGERPPRPRVAAGRRELKIQDPPQWLPPPARCRGRVRPGGGSGAFREVGAAQHPACSVPCKGISLHCWPARYSTEQGRSAPALSSTVVFPPCILNILITLMCLINNPLWQQWREITPNQNWVLKALGYGVGSTNVGL